MKLSKAFTSRMSSLVLAVSAIPGPALHAYPGLAAGGGASSSTPALPGVAGTDTGVVPAGDGGLPGGWTPADTGSALVRSAATFAVARLGEQFAGVYTVEDIRSAETQVVAGTNVLLRMRIAQVRDAILGARKDCEAVVYLPLGPRPQAQLASFTCQSVGGSTTTEMPV